MKLALVAGVLNELTDYGSIIKRRYTILCAVAHVRGEFAEMLKYNRDNFRDIGGYDREFVIEIFRLAMDGYITQDTIGVLDATSRCLRVYRVHLDSEHRLRVQMIVDVFMIMGNGERLHLWTNQKVYVIEHKI